MSEENFFQLFNRRHEPRNNHFLVDHQSGRLHDAIGGDVLVSFYLFDRCFEMEFAHLAPRVDRPKKYKAYSRRPPVQRDIALVIDERITYRQVIDKIWSFADTRVTDIELFDVYHGPPVPEGEKSMAFRITYQDPSSNLTDEEINGIQEGFLGRLLPGLGASLR